MPSGLWTRVGPSYYVLDGFQIPHVKGSFEGERGGPLYSIRTVCSELCKNGWSDRDVVWEVDSGGPKKHVLDWGEHWSHLANSIEPSVCGGDANYCQNTLTTGRPMGIGQAIIFCPVVSIFLFFLSSFFPSLNVSRRRLGVCHTSTQSWCGLSANLECMSEMCCTRLAENTGRKKSPSGHHRTTLSSYIFATKACIDNQKKNVKQQYFLHMSPQYGELRPTSGWDRFGSLGHPS